MENESLVSCRNCKSDIPKKIRRCPYCGILNPTVTIKEILNTTFIIIVLMYIITYFIK